MYAQFRQQKAPPPRLGGEGLLATGPFKLNIQASVVRRRFGHGSQHEMSHLGVVMDEFVAARLAEQTPDARAQILGDLYLLAEVAVERPGAWGRSSAGSSTPAGACWSCT